MFSCQKVGECYRLGLGIEQNDTLAFEWYMRAAEQNFRVAQKSVGDCYFNGCGVEQMICWLFNGIYSLPNVDFLLRNL